MAQVIK